MRFYGEATSSIRSMKLPEGLTTALHFLKKYIPISTFALFVWRRNTPYITQFWAGDTVAPKIVKHYVIMSEDSQEYWFSKGGTYVHIFDEKATNNAIAMCQGVLPDGAWSYMFLRVFLPESDSLSHLVACVPGHNRYGINEASFFYSFASPASKLFDYALGYQEAREQNILLTQSNKELHKEAYKGIVSIEKLPDMRDVTHQVIQVAKLNCHVLLLGETGVGKEYVADAIYSRSRRNQAPFIKVNCAAIPENLLDSELFGHEKGAFTSAVEKHIGRFERAHNGTLFLDEIAELSLSSQASLLRVLQSGELERIGGKETLKVDVRIIAATNADLSKLVSEGKFRSDLFYRLNVFPITVPPLRERPHDIIFLTNYMLQTFAFDAHLPVPILSEEDKKHLSSLRWPGNVRELRNVIERSFILWRGNPKQSFSISFPLDVVAASDTKKSLFLPLENVIRKHIINALELSNGRINGPGGAAELLGLNPGTLRSRMRVMGIPLPRDKKRP